MIVRKIQSPIYHRRRPQPLLGKGSEARQLDLFASVFEEALLDAVEGDVVRKGEKFTTTVTQLQRENLIRLSN